jgi:hypothetical protein
MPKCTPTQHNNKKNLKIHKKEQKKKKKKKEKEKDKIRSERLTSLLLSNLEPQKSRCSALASKQLKTLLLLLSLLLGV